jgi:hypothetical protein
LNKGINNVVTGYPGFDLFCSVKNLTIQFGKIKKKLKRIIWAPHHSMNELNQVSNFLEYYDVFFRVSINLQQSDTNSFKTTSLRKKKQDPNGSRKTSAYYSTWMFLGTVS